LKIAHVLSRTVIQVVGGGRDVTRGGQNSPGAKSVWGAE